MADKKDTKNDIHILDIVASAASLGLTLFVSLCIGIAAGNWLDHHFGTTPWLLVLGGMLSALSGFWSLYKRVQQYNKKENRQHRGES